MISGEKGAFDGSRDVPVVVFNDAFHWLRDLENTDTCTDLSLHVLNAFKAAQSRTCPDRLTLASNQCPTMLTCVRIHRGANSLLGGRGKSC